jgi:hypothetical protein
MTGSSPDTPAAKVLPTTDILKQQAKALRAGLASGDNPVSHSRSLELLAHKLGYRDWNTLHAASLNQPQSDMPVCPVSIGDRVQGHYLGQPFEAAVLKTEPLGRDSLFRVTFHFDEAVDVVTHTSFSAFRQRVTGNIDSKGVTPEKTSDGQPQISLQL